ncbi:MAG: cardiolipin synthase [Muribaculaceae bacterium]|nr:cardiolipin synthase [Muribaculaceae bacterium]
MYEAITNILTANWLYSVFAIIAVASTVVIIFVILSENRNPVKSLGWVTVLLLLPVVGLILYIFFGRNIKNTRMVSRRTRRKLRRGERRVNADPRSFGFETQSIQQINLARSLTGAQLYPSNSVEVFTDGKSKFDRLIEDLANARSSINLQYYIFEDDKLGNRIADVLIDKALKGVRVRLMYDHVGSFRVKSTFFKRLRDKGIEAYPFFRVTFPQLATRINWRNHRKICIIDQRIGYIGGMNVADRYIDGGKKFTTWRDTHVRIIGSSVAALQYSFAVDWNFMCGELIEDSAPEDSAVNIHSDAEIHKIGAQLLTSGPTSQWANVALAFHKAISNARRRVFIQTPYFLPTESLLKALQSAALAHVDVRLMLPRHSDSIMLTLASASYIAECLKAGIKIYFYEGGMLHSKMLLVDDEIVSIGSTNFDFRSFECNFEANMFFYSRNLAAKMLEVFKSDLKNCTRVQPAEWRRRNSGRKLAESVLRLLSPVL